MAAQMLAVTNLAAAGDNLVSTSFLYGGTTASSNTPSIAMGIEVRFARGDDSEEHRLADRRAHPGNLRRDHRQPSLQRSDFEAIAEIGRKHGVAVIVDNTFGAGGYLCQPIRWGANVVTHSATKWIGGHATSMGGVTVDGGNFDWGNGRYPLLSEPAEGYHGYNFWQKCGDQAFAVRARCKVLRDTGACLSPFNSFCCCRGSKRSRSAYSVRRTTPSKWPNGSNDTRRSKRKLPRSEEQPLPHPRPASTSPTDSAPSSRSGSRVPSSRRPPC